MNKIIFIKDNETMFEGSTVSPNCQTNFEDSRRLQASIGMIILGITFHHVFASFFYWYQLWNNEFYMYHHSTQNCTYLNFVFFRIVISYAQKIQLRNLNSTNKQHFNNFSKKKKTKIYIFLFKVSLHYDSIQFNSIQFSNKMFNSKHFQIIIFFIFLPNNMLVMDFLSNKN